MTFLSVNVEYNGHDATTLFIIFQETNYKNNYSLFSIGDQLRRSFMRYHIYITPSLAFDVEDQAWDFRSEG